MSKFKVGDKVVVCGGDIRTIARIDKWLDNEYGYYFNIDDELLNYYKEEDLELYKTPHERLVELGFIIDDETNYFIKYTFNGLDIVLYKKEKTYQTYVYQDNYNPINYELSKILTEYLEELK